MTTDYALDVVRQGTGRNPMLLHSRLATDLPGNDGGGFVPVAFAG